MLKNVSYIHPSLLVAFDATNTPSCLGDWSNNMLNKEQLWGAVFLNADLTLEPTSSWASAINPGNTSCLRTVVEMARGHDIVQVAPKALLTTRWIASWGHQIDSLTVLVDAFYRYKLNELGYKVVFDVQTSKWSANVLSIANIMLGDNFINVRDVDPGDSHMLHFDDVVFLKHHTDRRSFMGMPAPVNRVLHAVWDDRQPGVRNNVFLTRGTANAYRILANHHEIEAYFASKGVVILNPEGMANEDVYNVVKASANVILTPGSALTSLMYINPRTTRVFCIRSKGYLPEWRGNMTSQAELDAYTGERPDFEKSIWQTTTDRFDFHYFDSWDNVITEEQLATIVARFKP